MHGHVPDHKVIVEVDVKRTTRHTVTTVVKFDRSDMEPGETLNEAALRLMTLEGPDFKPGDEWESATAYGEDGVTP